MQISCSACWDQGGDRSVAKDLIQLTCRLAFSKSGEKNMAKNIQPLITLTWNIYLNLLEGIGEFKTRKHYCNSYLYFINAGLIFMCCFTMPLISKASLTLSDCCVWIWPICETKSRKIPLECVRKLRLWVWIYNNLIYDCDIKYPPVKHLRGCGSSSKMCECKR